ncbi:RuvB ATP-dependent DNA helicase pontin, partial [Cryomyces antarcticus]
MSVAPPPATKQQSGVQIAEVKDASRANRTATHSHIKGLGLRSDGYAERNAAGFVGQTGARE